MRLSWLVWGLGSMFYLIGFFHRLAPAVVTRELMQDFGISAAALGNLSGFYFYSYWLMQVPTGILADSWGPRRLLTAGALGAAAGAVIFGCAPDAAWAGIGRLLIGGCVAVAYVVILKLSVNWFPQAYFSMLSGLSLLAGTLGAVTAGVPLRLLADAFGWRGVMMAAAAATGILAGATWVLVRDDPAARGFRSHGPEPGGSKAATRRGAFSGAVEVFRHRNTWLLFLAPASLVGSVLTFCGLWGVPYLTTHYGFSTAEAASFTSLLIISWSGTSPVYGWLSDRLKRRKSLMLAGQGIAALCWSVLLLVPCLPAGWLAALIAATGMASSSFIVCWPLAKESVPSRLAGTIAGVINMGIMTGVTVLQPAVGWMLDRSWQGGVEGGVRIYSLGAYRSGFALMLGWILIGLGLLCFTRETGGRQRNEDVGRPAG